MEYQITRRSDVYGQHVRTEFVVRNDYRVVRYDQCQWTHKGIGSNVLRFDGGT